MAQTADVIVVGLGVAGAACAWRLAARGARVIALDRFSPPHEAGSSHGGSRITRQAIGEGEAYVPLALRAHPLWREAEAETGQSLMLTCGGLFIGPADGGGAHTGKPDFIRNTVAMARRFSIPHEVLTSAEAAARYPMLALTGEEMVCFEPGAGLLFPERCVAAQIDLARGHGAQVRLGETVLAIDEEGAGVRVTTDRGGYHAAQAVVAAGPWSAPLLGEAVGRRLRVYRQVMHWFEPDTPMDFGPERLPVFCWMYGGGAGDWFYGFPRLPGETAIKIAAEQFDQPLAGPEAQTQDIDAAEGAVMWARHAAGRVRGVSGRAVASRACLYTMASDSRFLIGRHPERERLIVVSACSGHGFKHAPAIGELVADLALTAEPPPLLAPFAL